MSYSMLYQRPFGDKENPFVYVETDALGNIVEEPWDNGLDHHVSFTKISTARRPKGESKAKLAFLSEEEPFDLYITESRLIFKRRTLKTKLKFNGSLIDLGVDALFKKSEDKEVEGLGVLGQIRYEWLAEVMYFEKTGWKNDNMLRFVYYDAEMSVWQVTVTFKGEMDVRFIANEILHMACRYRERMTDEKNDRLLEFIEKYKTAEIPPAADPKKSFSCASFPTVKTACAGEAMRPPL